MANSGALIKESIWRDRDFRNLPRLTQCTYMQLLSQKEIDCAGLLTLNMPLLAKGCEELNADDLENDLAVLEERRFVFVDFDTFEVFVRAYMRTAQVVKSPNVRKSALKSARMVESPRIRREVAAELRRLRHPEATAVANELDPSPTPPEGSANPSETLPEGLNGSERVPEPPRSVSVSVSESPSLGGYVGERRPECPTHEQNSDGNCRPCMRRRQWDEQHEADELDRRRTARAAAKALSDNCPTCHGTNLIDVGDNEVRKCDHQEDVS